jgi:hypothetical protein
MTLYNASSCQQQRFLLVAVACRNLTMIPNDANGNFTGLPAPRNTLPTIRDALFGQCFQAEVPLGQVGRGQPCTNPDQMLTIFTLAPSSVNRTVAVNTCQFPENTLLMVLRSNTTNTNGK